MCVLKGQAPQARSSPNLIPPGAISRGSAAIAEAFAWPTFTHSGRGAPEYGIQQSENSVVICYTYQSSNVCV
jgi:hypothetical protein